MDGPLLKGERPLSNELGDSTSSNCKMSIKRFLAINSCVDRVAETLTCKVKKLTEKAISINLC